MCGMMVILGTIVSQQATPSVSNIEECVTGATSTVYDYKWWTAWTYRNKIVTSKASTKTSTISKDKVASFKNKTNVSQTYEYEYSQTLAGSVNLGANIPIKAIEVEVGGEVSYSTTTIKANVKVPKNKTYTVYKKKKQDEIKFNNTVQKQHYLILDNSWNNEGAAYKDTSKFTKKYPEIVIDKN